MVKGKPAKPKAKEDSDATAEDSATGAVVELTMQALATSPPATRALIVIPAIGAVVTLALSVALITANQPGYGFGAFALCIVLMLVAVWALVKVLTRQVPQPAPATAAGLADAGFAKMPVLAHFVRAVETGPTADFLVQAFICPDAEPKSTPRLDHLGVLRLWADPRGGSITAHLVGEGREPHLDIRFVNSKNGWPANVTIRPCGTHPYRRERGMNYLHFDARVPASSDGSSSSVVAMSFRIVDKLGTQWVRRRGDDIHLTEVVRATTDDGAWTKVSLSLTDDHWHVFPAEGNHLHPKSRPDIDEMILALVVEFGEDRGSDRPGAGSGRVLIRNIRLSE